MKTLLFATALILGGATMAQATPGAAGAVPFCSKTVTDECMNPPSAHRAPAHPARHATRRHHAAAHRGTPMRG